MIFKHRSKDVEDTDWGLYFFGTIVFGFVLGIILVVLDEATRRGRSLPLFDLEMLDMLELALTNIPKMTEDFQ